MTAVDPPHRRSHHADDRSGRRGAAAGAGFPAAAARASQAHQSPQTGPSARPGGDGARRGATGHEGGSHAGEGRRGVAAGRWLRELGFGARLVLAGGREGLLRTLLSVVGVGVGVAVLLLAASVPTMLDSRQMRTDARSDTQHGENAPAAGDSTVLTLTIQSAYHDKQIQGRLVRPEGQHPMLPPGVTAMPPAGTMLASPALKDLLDSPDGALLRDRLPARIVGTIGDEGLSGPGELTFYAMRDDLAEGQPQVKRVAAYGAPSVHEPLTPFLTMLVLVIFVVLLMPVPMFIAAATRFGGEQRDRRLAAVRLVGADQAMTRRIAAGEALVSAVLGLVAGVGFFFAGRQFVERFEVDGLSVFSADVRPPLVFASLIAVAVPASALVLTLVALRRVVIEPLGVVRSAAARTHRRLWWRLLPPLAGAALLYPIIGRRGNFNPWQAGGGVTLMLLGVALLLPWTFDRIVGRLGSSGGLSWQMAVRRLQLTGGSAVRAVGTVAVAASGTIALQMLFAAASTDYTKYTGQDVTRTQAVTSMSVSALSTVHSAAEIDAKLRAGGATAVSTYRSEGVRFDADTALSLQVADCAALAELITFERCADGDAFYAPGPESALEVSAIAGHTVAAGDEEDQDKAPKWKVPPGLRVATARPDPYGHPSDGGLFVTPSAAPAASVNASYVSYVRIADDDDSHERLRNAAMSISPTLDISFMRARAVDSTFASIRRGLFAGSTVALLMVGMSLLVGTVEQLRERRRTLAALVAFGTRRSTMGWSILWQTLVPVVLGMVLATALGLGLGSLLLATVHVPWHVDWSGVATVNAIAGGVVLLVTAASLPLLRRLMRPDGLRFE